MGMEGGPHVAAGREPLKLWDSGPDVQWSGMLLLLLRPQGGRPGAIPAHTADNSNTKTSQRCLHCFRGTIQQGDQVGPW